MRFLDPVDFCCEMFTSYVFLVPVMHLVSTASRRIGRIDFVQHSVRSEVSKRLVVYLWYLLYMCVTTLALHILSRASVMCIYRHIQRDISRTIHTCFIHVCYLQPWNRTNYKLYTRSLFRMISFVLLVERDTIWSNLIRLQTQVHFMDLRMLTLLSMGRTQQCFDDQQKFIIVDVRGHIDEYRRSFKNMICTRRPSCGINRDESVSPLGDWAECE